MSKHTNSYSETSGLSLEGTIKIANMISENRCSEGLTLSQLRSKCSIVNFDVNEGKITQQLFTGTISECAKEAQNILDKASQSVNPTNIETKVRYAKELICEEGVGSSSKVEDVFADEFFQEKQVPLGESLSFDLNDLF